MNGLLLTLSERYGAGSSISVQMKLDFVVLFVLQGIASGTLLYVTFFEIFSAEGRKLHNKFIHILVAILGFIMMAALELVGKFN